MTKSFSEVDFNCRLAKYSKIPPMSCACMWIWPTVGRSLPRTVLSSKVICCFWPWASTLPVSCRSSKSLWCLASPEEHKHQKIYESKEWKSRKIPQYFTCGPGKPIFPGGPSEPCGEKEGWEIALCWDVSVCYIFSALWVDGEDMQLVIFGAQDPFSLLRIYYVCSSIFFYTIEYCFMVITLVSAQFDFVNFSSFIHGQVNSYKCTLSSQISYRLAL